MDCVSTHLLRDWLLTLKPDDVAWLLGLPEDTETEAPQRKDWEIEYEQYQERLGVQEDDPPEINERLSHLLEFHLLECHLSKSARRAHPHLQLECHLLKPSARGS